jgi:hypothetical protein
VNFEKKHDLLAGHTDEHHSKGMDEKRRLAWSPPQEGAANFVVGQRIKNFAPAHVWGGRKVTQVKPLALARKGGAEN